MSKQESRGKNNVALQSSISSRNFLEPPENNQASFPHPQREAPAPTRSERRLAASTPCISVIPWPLNDILPVTDGRDNAQPCEVVYKSHELKQHRAIHDPRSKALWGGAEWCTGDSLVQSDRRRDHRCLLSPNHAVPITSDTRGHIIYTWRKATSGMGGHCAG